MPKSSISMVVQGAWISREDKAILDQEVKTKKLKSATALASSIIRDWCEGKKQEQPKLKRR